eukprot:UN02728
MRKRCAEQCKRKPLVRYFLQLARIEENTKLVPISYVFCKQVRKMKHTQNVVIWLRVKGFQRLFLWCFPAKQPVRKFHLNSEKCVFKINSIHADTSKQF